MKINKYDLADKLGVSHQAVYKWFNGQCMPSAKNLIKMSKILSIPMEKVVSLFTKN